MSWFRVARLVGFTAIAFLALPLEAQRPGGVPGRFEIPGMDWPSNSAWRRRAAIVRSNRLLRLQQGDVRSLNAASSSARFAIGANTAASLAVTGTFHVPVIAIQYEDVDVAFSRQEFQDVLFASTPPLGRPYTLKTYYEQISGGRIAMFGRVFDPVRTDTTAEYYQQGCNGIGVRNSCPDGGQRFGKMLLATLDSISNRPGSDTAWSQFDNDGPDGLPNSGDDDGEVDFVTFLQPVKDGACMGSLGVWAHRWVMSVWNGGSKYVTKTPRRNAQGTPIPGQFIVVNNYTIQSQVGAPTGCTDPPGPPPFPAAYIMPIGTVAHETGHAFGLPDLYDPDRITSGTEGIGEWGIMGSGNYSRAWSPAGFDAWSLNELGWATIELLTTTRTIETRARQVSDTIFMAPSTNPNQFLLVENRQAVNSDTTMLNPANTSLPGGNPSCISNCRKMPGLLLWHIDVDLINARRSQNRINSGPIQGVALIQADGLNQLRTAGTVRNRGDHGDPYPGISANTKYSLRTTPAARTNQNSYIGFVIDQIEQLASGVMRFRFLKRNPSVVAASEAGATVTVGTTTVNRFEDVIPEGDQFTITTQASQVLNGGRSRVQFAAWSIGGLQTQTVTSGATPDTITANFTAEHRVQVRTTGTGGTVAASVGGDLVAGVFVASGSPVSLTASAGPGVAFVGWRGDTTAAGAVLTLPMNRPYDIEATFVTEVAVTVADATTQILGTERLTVEQKAFLDMLGNQNGFYDVGDYLALLRRNGQTVSPQLLRAAAARSKKADR